MIGNQLALIRRELWEHKAIYVSPLVIALVLSLIALTGQVSISAYDKELDLAMVAGSNVGEHERRAMLTGVLTLITSIFVLGAFVLMIFYSLDALYTERKDKSILFWRSLPVTDAETVISKLMTALIVIPFVTFAIIVATHLLNLVISSIWITIQGGDAGHLIWASGGLLGNWAATFIIIVALPLWVSPLVGWFLFVSAFTKRSPFLFAFLPIFVLPMLEKLITSNTAFFWEALYVRTFQPPLFHDIDASDLMVKDELRVSEHVVDLLAVVDLPGFLSSPSLWTGIVVCGLLTTAAIYVRRFRDES